MRVLILLCLGFAVALSLKIHGVAPEEKHKFKGTEFTCDTSKQIPISHVNDNYCDCEDGSDEPGTAACSNGKYYCRNRGSLPTKIHSSQVDDARCDCCDGSDEPKGVCSNTCDNSGSDQLLQIKTDIAIHKKAIQKGLPATKSYYATKAKAEKEAKEKGDQIYIIDTGEKAEYSLLVGQSSTKDIPEANQTFIISHFRDIVQKEKKKKRITIGKWVEWEKTDPPYTVGLYDYGDRTWNGIVRKTRVHYVCAETDKFVGVTEPGFAEYDIVFETPGACSHRKLALLEDQLRVLEGDEEEE